MSRANFVSGMFVYSFQSPYHECSSNDDNNNHVTMTPFTLALFEARLSLFGHGLKGTFYIIINGC